MRALLPMVAAGALTQEAIFLACDDLLLLREGDFDLALLHLEVWAAVCLRAEEPDTVHARIAPALRFEPRHSSAPQAK